jgi:hypothetical protein
MWPFKRNKEPRESVFLIDEETYKQHIKEHLLLELMCEHMEENRYGDWTITRPWMEAIKQGVGESFEDSWQQALASYSLSDLGSKYSIYVKQK